MRPSDSLMDCFNKYLTQEVEKSLQVLEFYIKLAYRDKTFLFVLFFILNAFKLQ